MMMMMTTTMTISLLLLTVVVGGALGFGISTSPAKATRRRVLAQQPLPPTGTDATQRSTAIAARFRAADDAVISGGPFLAHRERRRGGEAGGRSLLQSQLRARSTTDDDDDLCNAADGYQSPASSSTSSRSTPLDRPLIAAVDAAALLAFAAVGKSSHHTLGDAGAAADSIAAVAVTALPFLVSWFATSPLTNVYSTDPTEDQSLKDAFFQVLPGWAVAVPLGCILRGVIRGYVPPLPFVVVTLIATLLFLGLGRVLFNIVEDFFVEFV